MGDQSDLVVRTAPDPCLRYVAHPVLVIDDTVRSLMDRMLAAMYAHKGIGLAAPQVGIAQQIVVIDIGTRSDPIHQEEEISNPGPFRMVNPTIIWRSTETILFNEGCLSIPDIRGEVKRSAHVRVQYQDEHNQLCALDAKSMLAVCVQHELDHLNGVLFIDHLSPMRRELIGRKLHKRDRQRQKEKGSGS